MSHRQHVTRRSFMKGTAAAVAGAVAAPYVVPASALGIDGATAPSNRVVYGFIGCGLHGAGWNFDQIFGIRVVVITAGLFAIFMAALGSAAETQATWPFFVFDNGTGGQQVPFDRQATMLKELGCDGIAYSGTQRIPEMLAALDAQGLKMLSIYVGASVDPGQPPYPSDLKTAIEQLKGRDVQIWLPISGGTPSDASDERAAAMLREIADAAEKSGLRVALYPHVGAYVARIEDALRLVKKVDRKNVGTCFNLCHFLKLDDEKNLDMRLKEAMPHLFAVNINGADGGPTNSMGWDRLIQTLDRGRFDVDRVLTAVRQLGYTGPIGLQCYAIPGDCRENLARSISAWRKLTARATAEEGFRPIFDGKTLQGWDGNPKFWRVEDGAITGETTQDNPLPGNTFLIWRGGQPANFELQAEFRMPNPGFANSGIQYRSWEGPEKWRVSGYQADMDSLNDYTGICYGENYGGFRAQRGQKVGIGKVETFGDYNKLGTTIKKNDWNEYHIIANGNHIIQKINGRLMRELTDEDTGARKDGIIALQLHAGPPMKVQFRNIRLKELNGKKN